MFAPHRAHTYIRETKSEMKQYFLMRDQIKPRPPWAVPRAPTATRDVRAREDRPRFYLGGEVAAKVSDFGSNLLKCSREQMGTKPAKVGHLAPGAI